MSAGYWYLKRVNANPTIVLRIGNTDSCYYPFRGHNGFKYNNAIAIIYYYAETNDGHLFNSWP